MLLVLGASANSDRGCGRGRCAGANWVIGGVNQDLRPPGACAVRATLCDNGELGADGRSEAGQPVLAAARAWQGTRHGTHQTRPRRQLTAVSRG
ncbi:hypothetical protein IG631_20913 [Alternaria alternata]|nr:hypothetical protein IG631_20913 [Alternaria alternata]